MLTQNPSSLIPHLSSPLCFLTLPSYPAGLVATWMFLLGGTVGSFLNVVVYRLPAGLSLVHPGSHCPRCKHPIRWYDNVPILGWVLLGGRCRDCKAAIAVRYPLVEAFTAVLFLAAAVLEPSWQACAFHLVLLRTLLPAALIDYDGSPLPPWPALPALSVGLLARALAADGLSPAGPAGGGRAVVWPRDRGGRPGRRPVGRLGPAAAAAESTADGSADDSPLGRTFSRLASRPGHRSADRTAGFGRGGRAGAGDEIARRPASVSSAGSRPGVDRRLAVGRVGSAPPTKRKAFWWAMPTLLFLRLAAGEVDRVS